MELTARSSKVSSQVRTDTLLDRTSEYMTLLTSTAGPLLGYPLLGVSSLIQSVTVEPGTSTAMVSACVSRCMLKVQSVGFLLFMLV